jgi:diaminopimelate decarboxylase
LINIDGPDEIAWVVESAQRWGRQQRVGLRVVTTVGWSSQFGTRIDSGESLAAFAQISQHRELVPCGIHVHLGTGIKNVDAYIRAIKEVLEFARALQAQLGIRITCYDFGGGFAVPTVRSMNEWDGRMLSLGFPARMPIPADCPRPFDYADPIARLIREFYPGPDDQMPQLLFEPGRAITSSAQTLLLSVLTVKRAASGPPKLILDGGKNITMPLEWETHQLLAANKLEEDNVESYDIFGPLCHPGDIVMRNKLLPQMRPGDVISIMDAGAYFIPNQMNFSFPRPSAIMLDGASIREIRSRETYADIVRLDSLDLVDGGF